jgi:hypothetical protein
MRRYDGPRRRANRPRGAGLVHIRDAVAAFFAELEVQAQVEVRGGMRGPIRRGQRPWAWALEKIEAERQGGAG